MLFRSRFLAFLESEQVRKPVKFDLFEAEFDAANWQEPEESWDMLLDQRAQQLASLNKPIILGFSGGTDSLTIYQVLRRNRIPIYGVLIKTRKDILARRALPFIEKEAQEHGFKVLVLPQNLFENNFEYSSADWIFSDSNPRIHFGINAYADLDVHREYFGLTVDEDYIYVTGLEKPRIRIVRDVFYSYQDDTPWSMHTDPRIHSFFVSGDFPKLHIKQSYMLARLIKKVAVETNRPVTDFQKIHNASHFDYYRYCYEGCGRFGDMAYSVIQKVGNLSSQLYIPGFDPSQVVINSLKDKDIFSESLSDNSAFTKNYLNGLIALRKDHALKNIFQDPDNYFSIKTFHSKPYRLSI